MSSEHLDNEFIVSSQYIAITKLQGPIWCIVLWEKYVYAFLVCVLIDVIITSIKFKKRSTIAKLKKENVIWWGLNRYKELIRVVHAAWTSYSVTWGQFKAIVYRGMIKG